MWTECGSLGCRGAVWGAGVLFGVQRCCLRWDRTALCVSVLASPLGGYWRVGHVCTQFPPFMYVYTYVCMYVHLQARLLEEMDEEFGVDSLLKETVKDEKQKVHM